MIYIRPVVTTTKDERSTPCFVFGPTSIEAQVGSLLGTIGRRLERQVIGGFPESIRINLRIEALAAIAFGVFYAGAIAFLPVVLRRLGATPELLALYIAQNYLGSVFASFSIMLMRGRRPRWPAGRLTASAIR